MPQRQASVQVQVSVGVLNEAIRRATAAFRELALELQEDAGMEDHDEVTGLRQQVNGLRQEMAGLRDELRQAHEDLKAEKDKYEALFTPLTIPAGSIYGGGIYAPGTASPGGTFVYSGGSTYAAPGGSGGTSYHPGGVVTSGAASAYYPPAYTVSASPAALGLPSTVTISSGGKTETVNVTNVTLDGISYSSSDTISFGPESVPAA